MDNIVSPTPTPNLGEEYTHNTISNNIDYGVIDPLRWNAAAAPLTAPIPTPLPAPVGGGMLFGAVATVVRPSGVRTNTSGGGVGSGPVSGNSNIVFGYPVGDPPVPPPVGPPAPWPPPEPPLPAECGPCNPPAISTPPPVYPTPPPPLSIVIDYPEVISEPPPPVLPLRPDVFTPPPAIDPPPPLIVGKRVVFARDTYDVGDEIMYRIDVRNPTKERIDNIKLVDSLENRIIVIDDPQQLTSDSGGSIEVRKSTFVTYKVVVELGDVPTLSNQAKVRWQYEENTLESLSPTVNVVIIPPSERDLCPPKKNKPGY